MDKKYYDNLVVSSAPHLVTNLDTRKTMLMVIGALIPSFGVSIAVFGPRVISLTLVCVIASMGFEWLYNRLMHKRQTVGDMSAACSSNKKGKGQSHVLTAMGLKPKEIEGAIRFSFSEFNTVKEMDYVLDRLESAVSRFRRLGSFR